MMQKIRFQGKEYLLLDGVITSEDQFRKGEISYVFLKNNDVIRLNKIIGHVDEIEYIGDIEDIKPNPGALSNMLDQQIRFIKTILDGSIRVENKDHESFEAKNEALNKAVIEDIKKMDKDNLTI